MSESLEKNHERSILTQPGVYTKTNQAYARLEESIHLALQTYSNVHRGSGHFSLVTTHLYEKAREIVLEYMELNKTEYLVLFLSPQRAETFIRSFHSWSYKKLTSKEFGLPIGIVALAIEKKNLSKGIATDVGGGTTKLTSRKWVIWADAPDRFEAGTPAIINVIAFAKALLLIKEYGSQVFMEKANNFSLNEILDKDNFHGLKGKELMRALQNTLIGRQTLVPTLFGEQPFINLDNSASTQTFEPVWDTFRTILHQNLNKSRNLLDEVRNSCASFLGASLKDYDIIFTSNTTESVNLVANNYTKEQLTEPVVISSMLEHSSNDLPWRFIPGVQILRLNVDNNGFFDLNQLRDLLRTYNKEHQFGNKRIKLIALSGASNVLGTCNNLKTISEISKEFGVRLLIDAAQLVAHRKIDFQQYSPDFMVFSAHKVYAPFGCGVLVVKKGILSEHEKEEVNRSGEENIAGIAALGTSLKLMNRIGMDTISEEENDITKKAISGLSSIRGIKIYGLTEPDKIEFSSKLGVIPFSLGNKISHKVAKELAFYGGIGVRSGCHCAHLIVKKLVGMTPFFENFQWAIQKLFPSVRFPGVVRISLGIGTTEEEIDSLVRTLKTLSGKSRSHQNLKTVNEEFKDFIKKIEINVYS